MNDIILVDTREKWTQANSPDNHIKRYFEKYGIPYEVKKLDEGDYQIKGNPTITVDRKYGMQEVYSCLVGDKARFLREVRRCHEKKTKLVVLIEQPNLHSIQDVATKWVPKYGIVSGKEIARRMYRLHISYGVKFLFCNRRSTGRRIVEILTGEPGEK